MSSGNRLKVNVNAPNPITQIPGKEQNSKTQTVHRRDLEERTYEFAQAVRTFVKELPKTTGNLEDVKQLVRSSGSVAANWIEADESLSKKDFVMRAKICRKEAKESRLFLRLLEPGGTETSNAQRDKLAAEARELTLIFAAILRKTESK